MKNQRVNDRDGARKTKKFIFLQGLFKNKTCQSLAANINLHVRLILTDF